MRDMKANPNFFLRYCRYVSRSASVIASEVFQEICNVPISIERTRHCNAFVVSLAKSYAIISFDKGVDILVSQLEVVKF